MREKIQRASALMYFLLTCVTMLQLFSNIAIFVCAVALVLANFIGLLVLTVSLPQVKGVNATNMVYGFAFMVSAGAAVSGVGVGYLAYQLGDVQQFYTFLLLAAVGFVCAGSLYRTYLTARHIMHMSMREDDPSRKRAKAAFESLDGRLSQSHSPAAYVWRLCKASNLLKIA